MNTDYFGGLPWSLFFREKPDFAKGDEVLVCHIEVRRSGKNWNRYLLVDNIAFPFGPWGEELVGETYSHEHDHDVFFIDYKLIISYFNNESIKPLLNSWILSELYKECMRSGRYYSDIGEYCDDPELDSFFTIKKYLLDDYDYIGKRDPHNTARLTCIQFLRGFRTNWEKGQRELICDEDKNLDYIEGGYRYSYANEELFRPFVEREYLLRSHGHYIFDLKNCTSARQFRSIYADLLERGKVKKITTSKMYECIYKKTDDGEEQYSESYFKVSTPDRF